MRKYFGTLFLKEEQGTASNNPRGTKSSDSTRVRGGSWANRHSEAYFVSVKGDQLTLVTELTDAEKLTRDEAEVIREMLVDQWGLPI